MYVSMLAREWSRDWDLGPN